MPAPEAAVPEVLFLCMHNAARSQMAEALFNAYAGGRARAASAGVEPVRALSISAVAAMLEAGYDMRGQRPKAVTPAMIDRAARVVTIGCAEDPAFPPQIAADDWDVEDPAIAPMPRVRQIRDDIARRVRALLREMGIEPAR